MGEVALLSRSTNELDERRHGVWLAKRRGDKQYLIGALLDPDNRVMAAESLGELGAVEATEPLLRMLDAADPHPRIAAAKALGRLGAHEALPRLREVAIHDDQAIVRAWAIAAIGDIGETSDVDLLLTFLHDPSLRVRGAAVLALGDVGDARALEPLGEARRRVRRSPFEWYLYRRLYDRAIKALARPGSG